MTTFPRFNSELGQPTAVARSLRIAPSIAIAGAALLLTACATTPATTSTDDTVAAAGETGTSADTAEVLLVEGERVAMLWVRGMGCPLCANNVDRQLRQLDGVERVTVDLGTGLITAHLSADARPTRQQLERAVTNSGFTLARAEVSP